MSEENIINIYLHHLIAFTKSISVNSKPLIDVIATTIITIGETIPADTAASPNIKAPTVDSELAANAGLLKSHSLNISNDIAIIKNKKKNSPIGLHL